MFKKYIYLENKLNTESGFTLIEILLAVALVAILAGLSVVVFQQVQVRNDLDVARNTIVQSLRRAQTLSQVQEEDSGWGLKIATSTNEIILYKECTNDDQSGGECSTVGNTFANRHPDFDEDFNLPPTVTASCPDECDFFFIKFSGDLLRESGTTTLTASQINESRTINVNAKGRIKF